MISGALIREIVSLRQEGWERLCNSYNKSSRSALPATRRLASIFILGASSRGGTSATADLLQWQGSGCKTDAGRLLSLPGEEKPHLILSRLAYPGRAERFDDLMALDADGERASILMDELSSEIGWPLPQCDELRIYAIQLYRRLLLQWPTSLVKITIDDAIDRIHQQLIKAFPNGYRDGIEARRHVLRACVAVFPFVQTSLYDCSEVCEPHHLEGLAIPFQSIEEPPFVLPPPWRNATGDYLNGGNLLLRDPSNAWRLPFWRRVFARQHVQLLHLVRDPRESVQGLCDGWNYPYGFQTIPSDRELSISGYTDLCEGDASKWKQHCLNFSISRTLSEWILSEHRNMSLVQICGHQWREAHNQLLLDSDREGIPRSVVAFSMIRSRPQESFEAICRVLNLEHSPSGTERANSFSKNWIMTASTRPNPNRWKTSRFAKEIANLYETGYFDATCERIGLPTSSPIATHLMNNEEAAA